MHLDIDHPFVLLDDARTLGAAPARLYRAPVEIVRADAVVDVAPAMTALRAARSRGLHAAGFLAYEAAAAFEPALPRQPALPGATPLLWFGLFDRYDEVAAADVPALLPDPAGGWIGTVEPEIEAADHAAQLAKILALIAAGDIYQANLTFRATAAMEGDPLALYAKLRGRAAAGYGAVIATGTQTLLSFSPELFFALDGERLTARPMKGTARRGADPAEDAALASALQNDAKQRAENLMIVDLMRNDLARVAVPGSVRVPELFAVETYPTLHQMVSGITAVLAEKHDAIDVLAALFPCGSITGAPKVRAMEVIAQIEQTPRGFYTGAIGRIDASGDAMFNVAIRTLGLAQGVARAIIGTGGGIVADSLAHDEWEEAVAKSAFLHSAGCSFDLIETMAFDPHEGLLLLERHLARMRASAVTFGFRFDRHAARNELQAATFRLREPRRVRLVLAASGAVAIEVSATPAVLSAPLPVAVVPLPVTSGDLRLRHKTSDRAFYDRARGDNAEVVFVDRHGYLTEGSFTSLFVPKPGKGGRERLITPPLARGLLPGVLRAELIASGRAVEGDLTPDDLAEGFFLGNALRGLMPAVTVASRETCGL